MDQAISVSGQWVSELPGLSVAKKPTIELVNPYDSVAIRTSIKKFWELITKLIIRSHHTKVNDNNHRLYKPFVIDENFGDIITSVVMKLNAITNHTIRYYTPILQESSNTGHKVESPKFLETMRDISNTLILDSAFSSELFWYTRYPIIVEWHHILDIHAPAHIIHTLWKTYQGIVNMFGSEFKKLELQSENKNLSSQAHTDSLTNIPNRRSLLAVQERINQLKLKGEFVYVLLLDLDYFKKINDTYGHSAGDIVLRTVAQTLKEICTDCAEIARYGWEEFAVIWIGTDSQAKILAKKLQKCIKSIVISTVDGHVLPPLTVSIGKTLVSAENLDVFSAINNADTALYYAKDNWRDCIVSFDASMKPKNTKSTVVVPIDTRQENR